MSGAVDVTMSLGVEADRAVASAAEKAATTATRTVKALSIGLI